MYISALQSKNTVCSISDGINYFLIPWKIPDKRSKPFDNYTPGQKNSPPRIEMHIFTLKLQPNNFQS